MYLFILITCLYSLINRLFISNFWYNACEEKKIIDRVDIYYILYIPITNYYHFNTVIWY